MKEKCKKLLSVLLSMVMLFSITAGVDLSAYAESSSGQCGENVTYTFDESTGLLTISGTGDMYDYHLAGSPFYSNDAIKTVVIEYGITSIGDYAFRECRSLTSVTIPNSVTSIGYSAFDKCSNLKSATIGNSVTSIGAFAFYGCSSLTSIKIPDSVKTIEDCAFYNCSGLTSATIGNSVTSIGASAFSNCSSLTSVTIPNSVTRIGGGAFYNCESLISVTIPNSVTSIGDSAFYGCLNLASVKIPNSVTSIGDSVFYGCWNLTSVKIPNSVTSIGYKAFSGCSNLTSVAIPNSVTSIGNNAFYQVNNILYNGTASGSPWGANAVNDYLENTYFIEQNGYYVEWRETNPTDYYTVNLYTVEDDIKSDTPVYSFDTTDTFIEDISKLPYDFIEHQNYAITVTSKSNDTKYDPSEESEAYYFNYIIYRNITVTVYSDDNLVDNENFTVINNDAFNYNIMKYTGQLIDSIYINEEDVTDKFQDTITIKNVDNDKNIVIRIITCTHEWDDGEVIEEATCGQTGVIIYTCNVCGETSRRDIPPTENHDWDEGVLTQEATENKVGVIMHTCNVCGQTENEYIPITAKPDIQLLFNPVFTTSYFNYEETLSSDSCFDTTMLQEAPITYNYTYDEATGGVSGDLVLEAKKTEPICNYYEMPSLEEDRKLGIGDYFSVTVVMKNCPSIYSSQQFIQYSDNIEPACYCERLSSKKSYCSFAAMSDTSFNRFNKLIEGGLKAIDSNSASHLYQGLDDGEAGNESEIDPEKRVIKSINSKQKYEGYDEIPTTRVIPSYDEVFTDPKTGEIDYTFENLTVCNTFIFKIVGDGEIGFNLYDPDNTKVDAYGGAYLLATSAYGTDETQYITYANSAPEGTAKQNLAKFGAGNMTFFGGNINTGVVPTPDEPVEEKHIHNYSAKVTAPTCTEQGYTTYTCDNADGKCDSITYISDYTAIVAHTPVSANNKVDPTPAKDGHEADTICDVCKQTLEAGAVIPALGVNVTIADTHKSYGTVNMAWGVNNVKYGETVTVTATALEDCDFVGYEVAGKLVSKDATYTYVAYKDITITPVFVPHAEDTITVLFYDKYSNVVANYTDVTVEEFQAAMAASIPTAPTYAGYTFTGWSLTDEQIKALDQSTTIWAYYSQIKEELFTVKTTVDSTLTVTRGTEVTPTEYKVTFDTKATVYNENATAWSVDGTIVGYGDTYEFFVGSDITVEPVFAAVEAEATVTMIKNYLIQEGSHKVMFLASMNVPDGYTLVDHGFVYGKNLADADMTLENVGNTGMGAGAGVVKATSAGTSPVEQFGISYGIKAKTGKACAKAFLTVVKDGELQTIYSDAIEYAY